MKKVLTTLLTLSLLVPLATFAAYNDVQLTSGSAVTMTVGGSSLTFTVGAGSVQTLQVQSASVVANLQAGSQLDITSTSRTTFTYSVGSASATFTCTTSNSSLSITSTGAQDITITPSGNACTVPGTGPSGGGDSTPAPAPSTSGGSAPSSAVSTPAPVVVPAPVQAPVPAVAPVGVPVAPTVASPSPVAQLVSPVFNKDLSVGSRGDDVKRLQQLLAADKEIYPEGLVTGYLGNLTKAAIRKFQLKYGVIQKATDPGNGNLGPKTRAKMKEVYGSSVAPAPSASSGQATPAAASVPASSAPAASDNSAKLQQLNQLMQMLKQLQALQAALKAQQGQ